MRLPALALALLLVLAGCTSGDDDGVDSTDAPRSDPGSSTDTGGDASQESEEESDPPQPELPACGQVWEPGATLPQDYDGCLLRGEEPVQEVYECDDDRRLVVIDDRRFAFTGGEVVEPEDSPLQDGEAFSSAYSECIGE